MQDIDQRIRGGGDEGIPIRHPESRDFSGGQGSGQKIRGRGSDG